MLHLIHPAVVHFSVAFLVIGGLVESWGRWTDRSPASRYGERLVWIGIVFLVPTLFTGYLAANSVVVPDEARRLLDAHERNGWFVLGGFLLLAFWKSWSDDEPGRLESRLYAAALLAVVALTIYSALLGGEMVYGAGVGVG